MSQDRDALVVTARLRASVTAADGREASVVLSDRDGTLEVDIAHLPVLLASLPLPQRSLLPVPPVLAVLRRARQLLASTGLPDVVWDQPVDVRVDGRVVLRRRGGTWRPTARLAAPVAGALAGTVVLAAGLAAAATALLRGLSRFHRG